MTIHSADNDRRRTVTPLLDHAKRAGHFQREKTARDDRSGLHTVAPVVPLRRLLW